MIFSIVPAYIASWVPGSRPEPSTQSVELDRIDAHGRSNAPNLSDRIKKDIENGVYDCPICHDTIGPDVGNIWACLCCYQVYHPRCISHWAQTSTWSPSYLPWHCPTCKSLQFSYPKAGCWCRKGGLTQSTVTAGSCHRSCSRENRCGTRVNCVTYTCPSICHPGPCIPMECTEQCGMERLPDESMTGASTFDNQPPAPTYSYPLFSNNMTNNTYAPSRMSRSIYGYDDFVNRGRNIFGLQTNSQRRSRIGLINSNDSPSVLMDDVLVLLVPLSIINALVILWTTSRIERYTLPLSHQKFTEGTFRGKEQLLCLGAGAILVLFNTVLWGSILVRLNFCLRERFGLNTSRPPLTHDTPINTMKIIISKVLPIIYWLIYTGIAIILPCMLCFGPGFFWKFQMEGTCREFDTNIRIHDPGADYFGLQNKTLEKQQAFAPLYTKARSRYDYPSPEDYESHQFGIDLFNITKINATDPSSATRKPFEEHWRIMGIYGGKPLHMDFDLLHHAWRINEGSIKIDSNNSSSYFHRGQFSKSAIPNFATAIQNLTLVRNGTWTPTSENNRHTSLPELKLHIPHWYLFDKNCVYQSYMRVFKEGVGEEGFSRKEIGERRRTKWKIWKSESRREEVLRTASYGYGGHLGLEVCARRNEYTWSRNGKMGREEGMGDDLLVPLGLMAVVRKSMREERGMLKHGCKWTVYG